MAFLSSCEEGSQASVVDTTVLTGDLIDLGNLFSEEEELRLTETIRGLEATSGIDLVAVTVGHPGEGGITAFALDMTRRISPGKSGVNNGAIIYISDVLREVKVETGYGLEWMIPDSVSGLVIEVMRPDLAVSNYLEAFETGFKEIVSRTDSVNWQAALTPWESGAKAGLVQGQILRFSAKGLPRPYQEGVPENLQFHPNYFIEIIPEGTNISQQLYFSGYMRDMVDRIVYHDQTPTITALVLTTEPLRLGLMGMQ
ncbi:MAG: TPM domain-containing protein [Bacteroidia bacterium]|nr:TPM domain-containing protein [Bacteroidia bacterium]